LLTAGSNLKSQASWKVSEDSFDSDTNIDKQFSLLKAFDKRYNTNIGTVNITTPSILEREESKFGQFESVPNNKAPSS